MHLPSFEESLASQSLGSFSRDVSEDSTATRARSFLPSSLLLTLFDTVSVGGLRELSVTQLVAFVSLTFVFQVILLVPIASTIARFQLPVSLRRLIQLKREI